MYERSVFPLPNIDYWLWLTLKRDFGPGTITSLLEVFETPEAIYNATKEDLEEKNIFSKVIIKRVLNKSMKYVEKVKEDCKRFGIRILAFDSPYFPEKLKHIPDPPYVLYVRSKSKINLNDKLLIGMVGNREMTEYGRCIAGDIAQGLSEAGVVVVSGMARGIDGASHAAALTSGGTTVAVLGCGADICYPPEHKDLMNAIIEDGMVISEYPPKTPPKPENFPIRNRIISGLCDGTVVVEAPEKSGSLITADFALKQGRDVFVVPGDITREHSKGTNNLIKEGSILVTSALDILKEYELLYINTLKQSINKKDMEYKEYKEEETKESFNLPQDNIYEGLSQKEMVIIKNLSVKPVALELLSQKTGLAPDELSSMLMMLEINGFIKTLPGKNFVLNV